MLASTYVRVGPHSSCVHTSTFHSLSPSLSLALPFWYIHRMWNFSRESRPGRLNYALRSRCASQSFNVCFKAHKPQVRRMNKLPSPLSRTSCSLFVQCVRSILFEVIILVQTISRLAIIFGLIICRNSRASFQIKRPIRYSESFIRHFSSVSIAVNRGATSRRDGGKKEAETSGMKEKKKRGKKKKMRA